MVWMDVGLMGDDLAGAWANRCWSQWMTAWVDPGPGGHQSDGHQPEWILVQMDTSLMATSLVDLILDGP